MTGGPVENVRQIPLTKGKVALVDAADYERVSAHTCSAVCVRGRWYAQLWIGSPPRTVKLHRLIFGAAAHVQVGFVNGDSLDCRRSNLRRRKGAGFYKTAPQGDLSLRATLPKVEARAPAPRGRFVGLWRLPGGRFGARVSAGGTTRWLGTFATERDAALAVNVATRLLRTPDDRSKAWMDVNDVPAAVPLDELEAAVRDLAGMGCHRRHDKKGDGTAAPMTPQHP